MADPAGELALSSEQAATVAEYADLGVVLGEFKERRDALKLAIVKLLDGCSVGRLPDGRAVRQTLVSKREYVVKARKELRLTVSGAKGGGDGGE